MMKNFCFAVLLLLLAAGCRSTSSIDRTPARKPQPVKAVPTQNRPAPQRGEDPLFDKIFNRNPQNFEGSSLLSPKERDMLRENDVRRDPLIKRMHDDNRQKRNSGKDWVFGTKNGSYF